MRQLGTPITLPGRTDQQQASGGEASGLDGTVRISLSLHTVATRHEQSLDAYLGVVVGLAHQV